MELDGIRFFVVVGLLAANLFATMLVQRMLYNHHEQTAQKGADDGDCGIDRCEQEIPLA